MELQSLNPQELAAVVKNARQDWTSLYLQLNEQGNVVLPEMPKGLRSAISNHYRASRLKPHIHTMRDGRILIYLKENS